eukprot:1191230-Prymnesium_polylepis.1
MHSGWLLSSLHGKGGWSHRASTSATCAAACTGSSQPSPRTHRTPTRYTLRGVTMAARGTVREGGCARLIDDGGGDTLRMRRA